jgi:lysophospholipase L1-like esterase
VLAAGVATVLAAGTLAPALASPVATGLGHATPAASTRSAGSTNQAKPAKHGKSSEKPVVAGSRYLALGDSVPFGYRASNARPTPNYNKPKKLIGYPEDVASNLDLKLKNASCPGETTHSFYDTSAQSNGCENSYGSSQPGYRALFPLHVSYQGSQLKYAEKQLEKHPNTRLVTLMIGANDGFICQEKYPDMCASEIPALQKKITKHVKKIYKGIRNKAGYQGQLVLVTYYSMDYSNYVETIEAQDVNAALKKAGKKYDVRVANGFKQMKIAAKSQHGDSCAAGLLAPLKHTDPLQCDVHPSAAGHALLAQAVEQAIKE